MFHCTEVNSINVDLRSTVGFSWRGLVPLLQADNEAEILGCIRLRDAVDDVLYGFFCVGEKSAVISKQQPSDEFLSCYPVRCYTNNPVQAASMG